jgi:hypothetical protein
MAARDTYATREVLEAAASLLGRQPGAEERPLVRTQQIETSWCVLQ